MCRSRLGSIPTLCIRFRIVCGAVVPRCGRVVWSSVCAFVANRPAWAAWSRCLPLPRLVSYRVLACVVQLGVKSTGRQGRHAERSYGEGAWEVGGAQRRTCHAKQTAAARVALVRGAHGRGDVSSVRPAAVSGGSRCAAYAPSRPTLQTCTPIALSRRSWCSRSSRSCSPSWYWSSCLAGPCGAAGAGERAGSIGRSCPQGLAAGRQPPLSAGG